MDYDTVSFVSHESQAMSLGVFAVSILRNLVHLAFDVVEAGRPSPHLREAATSQSLTYFRPSVTNSESLFGPPSA